ncbi:hypothetical protein [Dickeya poaceiphila]|uniref:Glycosyltransferase family 2 protein n=1 Tax=Dickeya poaceiphila TaxID=568768 RepID=A0A5B8I2C4_9GAMM|nr:hypothetical protein [Dickeya poaceiphila]QDX29352.1 hypothetical protein Dpoa569_0001101 [Dickeya poaceiphila]
MSNQIFNSNDGNFDDYHHRTTSSIGIYCTVSSDELQLALHTLSIAACSEYVSHILILITDRETVDRKLLSLNFLGSSVDKLIIACGDYGSGYEISLSDGGYDQVSARNDALEMIYKKDVDWVMQHDADDIYDSAFYAKICKDCGAYEAVMTECYTLNSLSSYVVNSKLLKNIYGRTLINPHIRVWKKKLGLKYKRSALVSKTYANETRHCGVEFPDRMNLLLVKKPSHYHLHRLLNKRHSGFLDAGETLDIKLDDHIKEKVKMLIL